MRDAITKYVFQRFSKNSNFSVNILILENIFPVKRTMLLIFESVHYFQFYSPRSASLHIQSEVGKIGTRITPNMDTFNAVSYVDKFSHVWQI